MERSVRSRRAILAAIVSTSIGSLLVACSGSTQHPSETSAIVTGAGATSPSAASTTIILATQVVNPGATASLPVGSVTDVQGRQTSTASATPTAGGIIDDLRRGGYLIFVRHGDEDNKPETVTDLADCSQQSNLTEKGRRHAQQLGQAYQSLGIPIAAVYASPFCRTRETAQLAFGNATLVPELANDSFTPPVPLDAQRVALGRIIRTAGHAGGNVVVVAHSRSFQSASGVSKPNFAETIAFIPAADGTVQLRGRILVDDFIALGTRCVNLTPCV